MLSRDASSFFCVCLCVLLTTTAHLNAQRHLSASWQLEAGLSSHIAGYSGDIGHQGRYGVFSDTQWHLVAPGVGAAFRGQQQGKRIAWNLNLRRIRIQGADSVSNNALTFVRNLHFRNDMLEVAASADYPLLQLSGRLGHWTLSHRFSIEAGLALLHHAPKAQVDIHNPAYHTLNELGFNRPGEWHDLRALQTEGSTYANWIMTIPVGLSWTFSAHPGRGKPWHVTISGLWRLTKTDRLDDIQNQYADPWKMSPLGLALSSQSNASDMPPCASPPEIHTYQYQRGANPVNQSVRGNPDETDTYWTLGVSLKKSLTSSTSNVFHKRRFRGPTVVNKR